jgi:NTE family protein
MTDGGLGTDARKPGPRIGLALGGGSARGLAHVLMLEAFDELGLVPAIIAGTSMGAICGAAYAAGHTGAELREELMAVFGRRRHLLKRLAAKLRDGSPWLWSPRDNVTLFEMLLPDAMRRSFDTLKIPFLAIATDYYGIEQVVLDRGPLIPALAASSALPHLARPVVIEGRVLIDGGYVNPVPYDVIMDRADITVAVDGDAGGHDRGDPDPLPLHHAREAQGRGARHLHQAGGRRLRCTRLFPHRGNFPRR